MNTLESLHKNVSTFNVNKIIGDVLKLKEIQGALIAIIQKRLYYKGTTAEGDKLRTDFAKSSNKRLKGLKGAYSKNTEIKKRADGLPDDHVTLYQEGEFYNSFKTTFEKDTLFLNADFRDIYSNFKDSFSNENEFQQAILDISDEEKEQLFTLMLPHIEQMTMKWLATV